MQTYLHDREDFKTLLEVTTSKEKINDPSLVEKDYWIMHFLYGIQKAGLSFELKGGTSISKGFGIIHRFSEDIDLRIEPIEKLTTFKVYTGKNHDDEKQRNSRKAYFDWLSQFLEGKLQGHTGVKRDTEFDDPDKFRNGGIRLFYKTQFPVAAGLKEGILLEVGFDKTAPNQKKTISSWASNQARASKVDFIDNDAKEVPCYEPKYTFVEKLQAIVRKFRLYKEGKGSRTLPANFIRHYYDVFQLIDDSDVQKFIGTPEYTTHKRERFGKDDNKVSNSDAFKLSDVKDRESFEKQYVNTKSLYYKGQPEFQKILDRIGKDLDRL